MPGAAEGVGQVLNFQITFFRDGTFSKSGGVPVQGTWVQSGREVTINADKFAIGEKTYGLGKASMLSDLELSANGKVLSERGRGGINYTRG